MTSEAASAVRLADANVLIALAVSDHLHHQRVHDWFEQWPGALSTCPITQGALARFLIREGRSSAEAAGVLGVIAAAEWHRFWPDDLMIDATMLSGVVGHRQVTDAYLVALARFHDSKVVTLDQGLAQLHGPDHVELLET